MVKMKGMKGQLGVRVTVHKPGEDNTGKCLKVRPPSGSCETCTASTTTSGSSGTAMTASGDLDPELELPVWVGGCEKWINGLTKRTTCDDVIYALLRHENNPNDAIDITAYVIHERWRDVERPLRGRTKILKVCRAWGAESRNVRFHIAKGDSNMDTSSEVAHTKSGRPRRHHHHHHHHHHSRDHLASNQDAGAPDHTTGSQYPPGHRGETGGKSRAHGNNNNTKSRSRSAHPSAARRDRDPLRERCSSGGRRHEVLRSLASGDAQEWILGPEITKPGAGGPDVAHIRDPDRLSPGSVYPTVQGPYYQPDRDRGTRDRSRGRGGDSTESQRKSKAFHRMVQKIIEQEREIQEQLARIQDTDAQIENYETKAHMMRMKENGQNYLQEAYMRDRSEESSSGSEELFPTIKANDMEAYLHMCENILNLQDRITMEETKIEDLSTIIFEESRVEGDHGEQPESVGPYPTVTSSASRGGLSQSQVHPAERDILDQIERLRLEIEKSVSISENQQDEISALNETVETCDYEMQRKATLISHMTREFSGSRDSLHNPPAVPYTDANLDRRQWVGQDLGKIPRDYMTAGGSMECPNAGATVPGMMVPMDTCLSLETNTSPQDPLKGTSRHSDSGVESIGKSESEDSDQQGAPLLSPPTSEGSASDCVMEYKSGHMEYKSGHMEEFIKSQECHRVAERDLSLSFQQVDVQGRTMVPYRTYTTFDKARGGMEDYVTGGAGSQGNLPRRRKASGASNADLGLSTLTHEEKTAVLETLV